MKVNVITSYDAIDDRCGYTLTVESKEGIRGVVFCDGEAEDAKLMRDFSGVYKIPVLLERAYNAGRNGEKFEIEENEISWDDF